MAVRHILCAILLIAISCGHLNAADWYVATNGTDAAAGGIGTPWRSVQRALTTAGAGDTIYLRGGAYSTRVTFIRSGSIATGPVTLRGYPGETAAIDGTTLAVTEGWDALINLGGRSHIVISDLEVRNFRTTLNNHGPIGIFITNTSCNVILRNLSLYNIENTYDNGAPSITGSDAHGIAVYGTHPSQPVTNILIEGITIRNCKLGSSEALVINGNVDGFTIRNCRIFNNNNIGIDCIGHEGVCPSPAADQARNGLITGNEVWNISAAGNPAYRAAGGGFDLSAGGIYVDGGRDITIDRNQVHDCDIGIELGCENPGKSALRIIARNNFIYRNRVMGLGIGGYDETRGSAVDCGVIGNTFFSNDTTHTWSGEINLQWHITNGIFENNILCAPANSDGTTAIFVGGPGSAAAQPVNTHFNFNLYYSPAPDHLWTWGASELAFSGWTSRGHDVNAIHGPDPRLRAPAAGDLHIATNSPARDKGHVRADSGTLDIDGDARTTGGTIDIGADETASGTHNVALDFDGDRISDLAVYWPSSGGWYVRASSADTLRIDRWGWQTASPVAADYDGDGRADLAVYNAQGGKWFLLLSANGTARHLAWGWSTARPVPADYDGNGDDDIAVFDPAGAWYITTLSNEILAYPVRWGFTGCLPAAADYDGDGCADLAVFYPATGTWFIRSIAGRTIAWAVPWGFAGCVPVPGDYDGDGTADLAVFHAQSGRWFIRTMGGTVLAWGAKWGFNGCDAVPGDYDGDGRADLALYHQPRGEWYIWSLTRGMIAFRRPWGWRDTMPVSAQVMINR